MLYNYYFDITALIFGVIILSVYAIRRTLRNRSNRLLFVLLLCSVFGSIFDIASCFSISYPERYPMWVNYLTCYGYLIAYNFTGVMFLAYIDSKTKINVLFNPMRIYTHAVMAIEVIAILTSPFTHMVSYFDGDKVYRHGPLMFCLYAMALINLIISAILFVIKRRRFNRYQIMSFIVFASTVFTCVLIQAVVPSLLVGQFGNTLVLFFIYTSFENPVFYTYKSTTCFNRQAFLEIMKFKLREKADINLFILSIKDYENIKGSLDFKDLDRLSCVIAEALYESYGIHAYCIADDKFVIEVADGETEELIRANITEMFSEPILLVGRELKVHVKTAYIEHVDTSIKSDIVEDGIIYVLDNNLGASKDFKFDKIIEVQQRRKKITAVLKDAIKNDGFEVYYQPIFSVARNRFESAEALVRLKSDELGYISPEEFVPIAEMEGLIIQIGEIVFEKVCEFINRTKLMSTYGIKYIEINLSPIHCIQEDVVRRYRDIMDKYDIVPFWINLEITETAEIEKNDMMLKNIIRFHNMGILFSLDDYGSGFASADYLFRLPVDLVKIDKSILWQSMRNDNAGIVLIGTLRMLKNLGKKIVVEGVEDEKMAERLIDNGVDFLQGYYYSTPYSEEQYLDFLSKKNL